tara:strand:- start:290 stop:1210 length:921 start_codon:yes stop_codon:yes gene_type:complete
MSEDWTLNHLGMMVTDKNAALNQFQNLGLGISVGPQPLQPYEEGVGELTYFQTLEGDPVTHQYKTGGLHNFRDGNSQIGDCQLEVYPMKPGPGMFISEYLEKKGPGINHIAFNTPDIERDTKKFLENGCDLVFNATVNGKTIENYLDTRKHGDVMISLRPSADEWEIAWRENNKCHPLVKNWNFFGVGVVVNDCEIASEYFSNLGFSLEKGVHESEDLGIKFCHLKVGSMMFEFIEPTTDNSVYKECFNTRGEGIADMSFVVEDLASEVESLVSKGADLLISTNELALIDTRREGNILIRLLNINA